MKVTVSPTGEVTLEVTNGDGQAALDLVRGLQADAKAKAAKPKAKSPKSSQPRLKKGELSAHLFDALKFLAQNDIETGITAPQLAEHAKISKGAAGQRLLKLYHGGYAYRVKNGYYRAVKPTSEES